jgi:hypothetical protein
MIDQAPNAPETVEARAFLQHLTALANVSPDDPLVAEAVAACKLTDKAEFTGPEMQAVEAAIAQKVQLKLACSNDPDVGGLKALMSSVNRIVTARRESY